MITIEFPKGQEAQCDGCGAKTEKLVVVKVSHAKNVACKVCFGCARQLVLGMGYNDRRILDLEDEVIRLRDLTETLIETTRDSVNLARRLNDERSALESREPMDELPRVLKYRGRTIKLVTPCNLCPTNAECLGTGWCQGQNETGAKYEIPERSRESEPADAR
jgi:hypothetical protein